MRPYRKASKNAVICALGLLAMNAPIQAGEIAREDFDDVMSQCQEQRQRNIEPLRQQEIERCIDAGRGDREYCERFNRDFGEAMQTVNGTKPGLFWDLPICERAWAADRYFRMNPRAKVYTD